MEAALYADPVLRATMAAPLIVLGNADGDLKSLDGYTFPLIIVKCARGVGCVDQADDSMHSAQRTAHSPQSRKFPLMAVFKALTHKAPRLLLLLHSANYVHCDLHPSNVLWRADMHAWTLIDFDSASMAALILAHQRCCSFYPNICAATGFMAA
jgi:serine/threonine protein kinase